MNTYAMQLLLHFQEVSESDGRFEAFLAELNTLAARFGISVDDYQSFRLRGSEYRIHPCAKCKHLTIAREDVRDGIENMLPDFWFYVRRGGLVQNELVCDLCSPSDANVQPSIPADASRRR